MMSALSTKSALNHTFHLSLLEGFVEDVVDSPHLDRCGPQTHGVANVLSPGSYLAWGITRPMLIQAGWFSTDKIH